LTIDKQEEVIEKKQETIKIDTPLTPLPIPQPITQRGTVSPKPEVQKPKPETGKLTTEKHSFTEWLKLSGKTLPSPKSSEKVTVQQDIIDTFIQKEPRIVPSKGEFYSPVNMARLSVADHDDIISETLAKIYFDQGNYPKAIATYEKLSLIYPEKKLYFAARINSVKQFLTENNK